MSFIGLLIATFALAAIVGLGFVTVVYYEIAKTAKGGMKVVFSLLSVIVGLVFIGSMSSVWTAKAAQEMSTWDRILPMVFSAMSILVFTIIVIRSFAPASWFGALDRFHETIVKDFEVVDRT